MKRKGKVTAMKMLILSDIHANWPALAAVAAEETHPDLTVFLGDVVDYGPSPRECVRWVQQHADRYVRGNHDNALAFDQDCHCMGSFREYSLATRAWHRTLLGGDDVKFLAGMPILDWFEFDGRHFRMAHATPQGDLFAYLSPDQWQSHLGDIAADFVLLGHTHVQGMRTFGKCTVVNPGSVGLARDGGGEACYAVYDSGNITLKRIPYDVSETVAALHRASLQPQVIAGLEAVLTSGKRAAPPAGA